MVRVLREVYGSDLSLDMIRKAVFSFPPFVGYNHSRVVRVLREVYGSDLSLDMIRKTVFTFPRFTSSDHSRVFNMLSRFAKRFGVSKQDLIETIFKMPALVSYSKIRHFASWDAFRRVLKKHPSLGEGLSNEEGIRIFLSYFGKSPYPLKGSKLKESFVERRDRSSPVSVFGQAVRRSLEARRKRRMKK